MSSLNNVTVILDGQRYELELVNNQTILEAAIDADIDPPFACQAAACCTCRAKLLAGEVKMDDDDILSDWELDQGFILTCQSRPTTPGVVVSYDEE